MKDRKKHDRTNWVMPPVEHHLCVFMCMCYVHRRSKFVGVRESANAYYRLEKHEAAGLIVPLDSRACRFHPLCPCKPVKPRDEVNERIPTTRQSEE